MQERETGADRLAAFLRERRESRDWKVENLARRAGLDKSYLSRIERGLTSERGKVVPRETLEKLALAYQVSIEELDAVILGNAPPPVMTPRTVDELLEEARMISPMAIPVIEHPAHAGHSGTPIIDYVYVERTFAVNRDLLCIPVKGDCMQPLIMPGDKVIVDRGLSAEQGRVVVAVVDEQVWVRRFYVTNSHMILRADAEGYPDVVATEGDIVGVVVEIRKRP